MCPKGEAKNFSQSILGTKWPLGVPQRGRTMALQEHKAGGDR